MSRLAVFVAMTSWLGVTLLLSTSRRLSPPPLRDRLLPYHPRVERDAPKRLTLAELVSPVAVAVGNRLSALVGVSEPLAIKLRRIHDEREPAQVRVQQFTAAVITMLVSTAICVVAQWPPLTSAGLIITLTVLVALVMEQLLVQKATIWQANELAELPVVAEQLAMLVSAGWSLTAAMARIAERGNGCCAADLRRIGQRIRVGISETDALDEWATVSGLDQVARLVSILNLHRQTTELGRLIADEARSIRNDGHRRLIEMLDRRAQQVWIPVTVAALVPGTIVIAVPFFDVISKFSQTS
jgi:tight adherence protein C